MGRPLASGLWPDAGWAIVRGGSLGGRAVEWGLNWLERRVWAAATALLLLCAILFSPGFFSLPPADRDEASFAQASRQMLESGDLIDIRLGEVARHKKPVGIYWLQAAVVALVGDRSDIAAYRLVSLLGAAGAVLLTRAIGAVLAGERAGLVAAVLLASCLMLGAEARLAKTDAMLLCMILASQWVLARAWMGMPVGWGGVLVFWGGLAVGTLIKGPIGPMVLGLTVVGLIAAGRQVRWLAVLRPFWGLAIWAALVLPWVLAITWITGGAFWSEALGQDLLAKVGAVQELHGAPPGSYALAFWVSFWPGSVFVLLAVPGVWALRRERAVWFCLAWAVPLWLVFEAAATKLVHYTLPGYPALAILAAIGLSASGQTGMPALTSGWRRIAVALVLAAPLVLLAWLGVEAVRRGGSGWYVLAGLTGGGFAVWGLWRALRGGALAAALACAVALSLAFALGTYPTLARVQAIWPSEAVALLVRGDAACAAGPAISVGYGEPSLLFALGSGVRFLDPEAAAVAMAGLARRGTCGVVIIEDRERGRFDLAARRADLLLREVGRAEGVNIGSGRQVGLAVLASR